MSDRWSLDGRVALVTGGGKGIGLGCARELARVGAEVIVAARTASDVEAAAAGIEAEGGSAHALAVDVTNERDVARMLACAQELGGAHVLVNAAGTNRTGPAVDYALADWDALFAVNVRATFLTCREFAAAALDDGRAASVVNVSSQMGSVGYPGRSAYCATKHAVEGLTKALGVEWAARGIRVNAVAPTFVRTPLTEGMLADADFAADVVRRLPTGELATVEQVADAVRYLACDASGSVTGAVLRVDGGWTAW